MRNSMSWGPAGITKKTRTKKNSKQAADSDSEGETAPVRPLILGGRASVHSSHNCVFFQDEISTDTISALNKEMRAVADKMLLISTIHKRSPQPIWLHLTTNGGDIYAAFSAIDCILNLGVPVYTVVDGFVASAGTLISVAATRRYIMPNAYMLLHELRSSMWGKFSDISDEVSNLKKIMAHIVSIYGEYTTIPARKLETILKKDIIWNAAECTKHGVVDGVFKGYSHDS